MSEGADSRTVKSTSCGSKAPTPVLAQSNVPRHLWISLLTPLSPNRDKTSPVPHQAIPSRPRTPQLARARLGAGKAAITPPPISALPLINHTPTTPPGPLTPSAASRRPHKAPPMWWGYIDTIDAFRAPSWASWGPGRFRRPPTPPTTPRLPLTPLPFLGRVTRRVPLLAHADSPPMHPMSLL